jgi:UDP-N-acetylglucosamine 2-epimerase (non-hydrolysing)
MKILCVAGARPNFIKIAPLMAQLGRHPELTAQLVHTGQHYDAAMSDSFFAELEMPVPDHFLRVGSGTHAEQTGRVMIEFERVLLQERPDLVMVVGDVNSTLACALVAAKCQVALAHVEAGLRSYDPAMPEEINRKLTDVLADHLYTTCLSAHENLKREGVDEGKMHFVGNVMIDTLRKYEAHARAKDVPASLGLEPGRYALLTLHRPSNVDDPRVLAGILDGIEQVSHHLPVVFPIHPRTRRRLAETGLEARLARVPALRLTDPFGYIQFLGLTLDARLVLTDSGGLQEETTVLGIPCLTLRENTERPVTVTHGTNTVIGCTTERIVSSALAALDAPRQAASPPPLWDGRAAERIVQHLLTLRRH